MNETHVPGTPSAMTAVDAGSEPGCASRPYVVYAAENAVSAPTRPIAIRSQPIALRGCRDATRAPTAGKTTAVEKKKNTSAVGSVPRTCVRYERTKNTAAATASAK